jgi:hypothetical protein
VTSSASQKNKKMSNSSASASRARNTVPPFCYDIGVISLVVLVVWKGWMCPPPPLSQQQTIRRSVGPVQPRPSFSDQYTPRQAGSKCTCWFGESHHLTSHSATTRVCVSGLRLHSANEESKNPEPKVLAKGNSAHQNQPKGLRIIPTT